MSQQLASHEQASQDTAATTLDGVSLTSRAGRQVAKIAANEPSGTALRIAVEGGGCSGFQYTFDLVQERENDDIVLEADGGTVLVDAISVEYMRGAVIDYVDDLIGASFKITNPNAVAACGCGTSFSM
ncbi:MAG: iron-sulfur cluster assembly accessory protein [Pseudomonadota bacterium]